MLIPFVEEPPHMDSLCGEFLHSDSCCGGAYTYWLPLVEDCHTLIPCGGASIYMYIYTLFPVCEGSPTYGFLFIEGPPHTNSFCGGASTY